jgi:hypothetical protein
MRPCLFDLQIDALSQFGQPGDLARENMALISQSGLGRKYTSICRTVPLFVADEPGLSPASTWVEVVS